MVLVIMNWFIYYSICNLNSIFLLMFFFNFQARRGCCKRESLSAKTEAGFSWSRRKIPRDCSSKYTTQKLTLLFISSNSFWTEISVFGGYSRFLGLFYKKTPKSRFFLYIVKIIPFWRGFQGIRVNNDFFRTEIYGAIFCSQIYGLEVWHKFFIFILQIQLVLW